jgi:hypothetical protein
MKTQPTTNPVLLYGSAVGFVLGVLAPMLFGFPVVSAMGSFIFLSIFTGPLGAILGAYIAVFWKTTDPERKKLAGFLFPKLGGVVGAILGFWIPTVLVFQILVQETFENMVPGIIYGGCAGAVIAPLGAASGVYLARKLMKIWLDEDISN